MTDISKIVDLLDDQATERRVAAAIVLGAIQARGAEVVEGLLGLIDTGEAVLIRHALDALGAIGARKVAGRILPFVTARDPDVRRAAEHALVSIGESVVPLIRERMEKAAPDEQRALNHLLAELGGAEAFSTLLEGMLTSEGDPAAALAARQQVRSADATLKKKYLAETEKFLRNQRKGGDHPGAVAAAIKVLGFLEDAKSVSTLLAFARASDQPPGVRKESIIALRFALTSSSKPSKEVIDALVAASGAEDRALAQTALLTLGGLKLAPEHSQQIRKLAEHPDFDRARLAIEHLGRQRDANAAKVLMELLQTAESRRAEVAIQALSGYDDIGGSLTKALISATDGERVRSIARALMPRVAELAPAIKKQLRAHALEVAASDEPGADAVLDVARMADPRAMVEELRAVAAKQRKTGKLEEASRTLTALCRTDQADDEDRYSRAALDVKRRAHDGARGARSHDPSLLALGQLAQRGFDVGTALRKDKLLDLADLYYIGFHFAERRHPLGVELLEEVAEKGGRTKLGKMAKNKLALTST